MNSDASHLLREPAFVGRQAEMAFARSQLEAARLGHGSLLTIEGAAGSGKSRFVAELIERARELPVRVFALHAVTNSVQKPLGLFSQLGLALKEHYLHDRSLLDRIHQRLGARLNDLIAVLPEFSFLGAQPFTQAASNFSEQAKTALLMLLDCLGDNKIGALVLCDDLQAVDELSREVIIQWAESRLALTYSLWVVLYRPNSEKFTERLTHVQRCSRISLSRLDANSCRLLLDSIAGPIDASVLSLIRKLALDSPFMLVAVLRGLIESNSIENRSGCWQFLANSTQEDKLTSDPAVFLARRIRLLPECSIELLKAAAIIGREFDPTVLCSVLDNNSLNFQVAIEEPVKRQILVEYKPQSGFFAFTHDTLIEAALQLIGPVEKRNLHRRYADYLRTTSPERYFDISCHYASADELTRALPYALKAAEDASARRALEIAILHFEIALRGLFLSKNNAALLHRISEGYADVLTRSGRYTEAEEHLKRAWNATDSIQSRASIDCKLCQLYSKSANTKSALTVIERSLVALGEKIPQLGFIFYGSLLKESCTQVLHSLLPQWFLHKKDPERALTEILKVRLHNHRMYALYFECRALEGLLTHLVALNSAERFRPTPELAHAYAIHGLFMSYIPLFSRGLHYSQRSLDLRKRSNDLWGQTNSLHFFGVLCYVGSRYSLSLDLLLRAEKLLDQVSGRWELDMVRCNIGYVYYRLGLLNRAVMVSRTTCFESIEAADLQTASACFSAWSKASGGDIDLPCLNELLRRVEATDIQSLVELKQALAIAMLRRAEFQMAADILQSGWDLFQRKGMVQEYVLPTIPWLATALRLLQSQEVKGSVQYKTIQKRRRYVLRRGFYLMHRFQNNLPHTLREIAIYNFEIGRTQKAKKLIQKSITVAAAQRARVEHGLSQLTRCSIEAEDASRCQVVTDLLTSLGMPIEFLKILSLSSLRIGCSYEQ